MYSEIWNWKKCRDKIRTLRGCLGFPDASVLKFLGLSLSLENGRIQDDLRKNFYSSIEPSVYCILFGYADAQPMPETRRLVSFAQLSGGRSYQSAFAQRVAKPIERIFGSKVSMLYQAAKLLGGEKLSYGDCSVKIYSLPLVPITIILWTETSEFPASANILFDSSANNYLSTEQIVMLSELTSVRLRHASEMLITKSYVTSNFLNKGSLAIDTEQLKRASWIKHTLRSCAYRKQPRRISECYKTHFLDVFVRSVRSRFCFNRRNQSPRKLNQSGSLFFR